MDHRLYLLTLLALLNFLKPTNSSPFELTDEYVAEVSKGIEDLMKVAELTQFKDSDYNPDGYNETEALKEAKDYDFIIVGAGTSGSVLANRLTEVPEWKVLLLEAGAPETLVTQIPSMTNILKNTPYNWGYTTTPQDSWCLGMEEKKCSIPIGRSLGGSTAINSMVYHRGNPRDYDEWADLGNDGWCHKDMFPYFLKSENANLKEFDRRYHKQGGPLQVEDPQYRSKLAEVFGEASKELGMKIVDYNGKEQLGFGYPEATTKSGKRNSVANAYLVPIRRRRNLTVKPLSAVIKIIVSPHTKEAYGVKYLQGDKLQIAKATKEVILAAGALNTPKLLMLSGIGPKDEVLEKLDIHQVQNLPVGKHLKDHAAFLGVNYVLEEPKEATNGKEELIEFLKNGKGVMTGIETEGIAHIKTEHSKDRTNNPDIQLIFLPETMTEPNIKHMRIKRDIYESHWKPTETKKSFTIAVIATQPKSTGTLTITSKNPLQQPHIHLPQFSDPDDHDLRTTLAGIHKAVEYHKTPAFQKINAKLVTNPVKGCEQHEFGSDEYWKCALRFLSVSLGDVSGTAKMGPESDEEAVVDEKLRVYGVGRLRVADASVIPVSLTGNLHAPVVALGEKAADLIKEEWQ